MGQSTEELSGDIEETRRSMSSNVDALQDRVSPAAIVERRKEAARGRARSVRDRVMGTAQGVRSSASDSVGSTQESAHGAVGSVKDAAHDKVEGSPMAAGLVAFGAGLVIASLIPASDKEARVAAQVVDTVKDKGQPLIEDAKAAAQDVAHNVAESAGEAVSTVKDTASQGAQRVREEGKASADEVRAQSGS